MQVIYDGLVLNGTVLDILTGLRDDAGFKQMDLGKYLDFMCENYYKMLGVQIERTQSVYKDAQTLFNTLAKLGVMKIS